MTHIGQRGIKRPVRGRGRCLGGGRSWGEIAIKPEEVGEGPVFEETHIRLLQVEMQQEGIFIVAYFLAWERFRVFKSNLSKEFH